MCTGCLLLGRWRATRDVRHRLSSCGKILPGWYGNRDGYELPCRQLLCRRGGKCGYVGLRMKLWPSPVLVCGLSLTMCSRSRVHVHGRLREYGDRAIRMRNDCGALQPVCTGCLLLGRWRATRDVRHRLSSCGKILPGWYGNRDGYELPCRQLLCRRGGKCGYVGLRMKLWPSPVLVCGLSLTMCSRSRVHVHGRLREYGDRAIRMRNDCGALQPVCSRIVLLGRWRATRDVPHRLGSGRQLLSCWHNNLVGHDLPHGQLLRRRGGECEYVAGVHGSGCRCGGRDCCNSCCVLLQQCCA